MNDDLQAQVKNVIGVLQERLLAGVGGYNVAAQESVVADCTRAVLDVEDLFAKTDEKSKAAALRAVPQTPDELKQYACDGLNKMLGSMVGRTYLGSDGLRVYGALQTAIMSGDPRAAAFLQYWSGLVGETTPKE